MPPELHSVLSQDYERLRTHGSGAFFVREVGTDARIGDALTWPVGRFPVDVVGDFVIAASEAPLAALRTSRS